MLGLGNNGTQFHARRDIWTSSGVIPLAHLDSPRCWSKAFLTEAISASPQHLFIIINMTPTAFIFYPVVLGKDFLVVLCVIRHAYYASTNGTTMHHPQLEEITESPVWQSYPKVVIDNSIMIHRVYWVDTKGHNYMFSDPKQHVYYCGETKNVWDMCMQSNIRVWC